MALVPRLRAVLVGLTLAGVTITPSSATAANGPSETGTRFPQAAAATVGSKFVAVSPKRIADTRNRLGSSIEGRLWAGATTRVQVVGRREVLVPADATAVVLNVTTTDTSAAGWFTVYPTGTKQPNASNLNFERGQTVANFVTVRLGTGGAVNIYSSAPAHVIVDVFGYYRPVTGPVTAGRVVQAGPFRDYDSRNSRSPLRSKEQRTITLRSVPTGATAAILNMTVTETTSGGYWSMYPPGTRLWNGEPSTSNINVTGANQTMANQVIVPIGSDRKVTIFSQRGGHVIVDVFGYVTGPTAGASTSGLFVPLGSPSRMLDTRSSNNPLGSGKRMWNGWTVEVGVGGRASIPRSNVAMVVGNITYVDSHDWGWVTAFAAGQLDPGTSNVNAFRGGQVVPNHATIPVSSRGVSLFSSSGGHLILDVAGYYLGQPRPATYGAPLNQTPPPRWPMTLSIPRIGLTTTVFGDTADATLRRGVGWWRGTAYPGLTGNMTIFGHRTDCAPFPACGPFYHLDVLRPGDRITVAGDHRNSVYEVFDASSSDYFNGFMVVAASNVRPQLASDGRDILTLIACSQPDGRATSLSHRIVVKARLVSYTNT